MKNGEAGTRRRPGRSKLAVRPRNRLSARTKIVAAIEEATEVLRTEGLQSKRLTIRTFKVPPPPSRICRPGDVKRVGNCGKARPCWRGSLASTSTRCDHGSKAGGRLSRSHAGSWPRSSRTPHTGVIVSGNRRNQLLLGEENSTTNNTNLTNKTGSTTNRVRNSRFRSPRGNSNLLSRNPIREIHKIRG